MKAPRFVIEGVWAGYTCRQDRVVHRQAYQGSRRHLRAWAESTHSVLFTDGTRLLLSVRECAPRERVQEVLGYSALIEDCARQGVRTVEDLNDLQERPATPTTTRSIA